MKSLWIFGIVAVLGIGTAFAQTDDYARMEVGIGYGNLGLPSGSGTVRHSGFAMQTDLNLNSWFGIENFTGYYGLGQNASMFTNLIGPRIVARRIGNGRLAPFATAGLGVAYFTQQTSFGTFGGSEFGARYGGGVDVRLNEMLTLRLDASRNSIRSGGWQSGNQIAASVVFRVQ